MPEDGEDVGVRMIEGSLEADVVVDGSLSVSGGCLLIDAAISLQRQKYDFEAMAG